MRGSRVALVVVLSLVLAAALLVTRFVSAADSPELGESVVVHPTARPSTPPRTTTAPGGGPTSPTATGSTPSTTSTATQASPVRHCAPAADDDDCDDDDDDD